MQPTKDVLKLLAPLLPPQPVDKQGNPPHTASADVTSVANKAEAAPQQSASEEQAEVQEFVHRQGFGSGLLGVSAALLETLLCHPGHPAVSSASEDLLQIEVLLRGECCTARKWSIMSVKYLSKVGIRNGDLDGMLPCHICEQPD